MIGRKTIFLTKQYLPENINDINFGYGGFAIKNYICGVKFIDIKIV